jgi:SAM-dependent methyltransferase
MNIKLSTKSIKQFKKKIGRLLVGRNPFDLAYLFCQGLGLEVGARNNPYAFSKKSKIYYADIYSAEIVKEKMFSRKQIPDKYKKGFFPKVDFILKPPQYGFDMVQDDYFDFVFSDNVLEHTPNFIYALAEQIRVVRPGGVIYGIIPNKNYSFDMHRQPTPLSVFRDKYAKSIFQPTFDEALDIIQNSLEFTSFDYSDLEKNKIAETMLLENDGSQHFHVFDATNTLEVLQYIATKFNVCIEYFSAPVNKHIHFALRKCNKFQ